MDSSESNSRKKRWNEPFFPHLIKYCCCVWDPFIPGSQRNDKEFSNNTKNLPCKLK